MLPLAEEILRRVYGEAERKYAVRWRRPSESVLKREYKVEIELKGQDHLFDSLGDFLDRVRDGEVVSLSKSMDRNISYRSRTSTREQLLGLIRSYRSYPEFRNEKTVGELYDIIGGVETWTDGHASRYSIL